MSQQPRSNGLGIAGFVVSLVGIFTLGLLCPIGLLLSFIALFRAPRGFAAAGFIIGFIGSLVPLFFISVFGFAIFSCFTMGRPFLNTMVTMQQSKQKVDNYERTHGGALPATDAEGDLVIGPVQDGWGHGIQFRRTGPGGYELISAGPDGIFNTTDDVTQKYASSGGPVEE